MGFFLLVEIDNFMSKLSLIKTFDQHGFKTLLKREVKANQTDPNRFFPIPAISNCKNAMKKVFLPL